MYSVPMEMLLLLLWGTVSLADPQCERSSAVRISVSSWRNQTGHRLVAAEMRSDFSLKDAVSLSVDQWTERCGDACTVALGVVASSSGSTNTSKTPIPSIPVPNIPVPYSTYPTTPVASSSDFTTPFPTTPVSSTRTTSVTVQPTPRPDYRHLPGHGYYKKHGIGMTWEEGRRRCESEGAHLVVLETREEFDAVYNFSDCCPWIGVYRQDTSSQWMTVLGQPYEDSGFKPWLPNAPTNNENCVLFDRSSVRGINSQSCTFRAFPVLCEQDG